VFSSGRKKSEVLKISGASYTGDLTTGSDFFCNKIKNKRKLTGDFLNKYEGESTENRKVG
jgi:hypothetical protein